MKKALVFFIVNNTLALSGYFNTVKIPKNLHKKFFVFEKNTDNQSNEEDTLEPLKPLHIDPFSVDTDLSTNKDNEIKSIIKEAEKFLKKESIQEPFEVLEEDTVQLKKSSSWEPIEFSSKDSQIEEEENFSDASSSSQDWDDLERISKIIELGDFKKITKKMENELDAINQKYNNKFCPTIHNKIKEALEKIKNLQKIKNHPIVQLKLKLENKDSYIKNINQLGLKYFIEDVILCVDIINNAKDLYFIDLAKKILDTLKSIEESDLLQDKISKNICDSVINARKKFEPRERYWYEPVFYYQFLLEKEKEAFDQKKSDLIRFVNDIKKAYAIS